jgi:hypothetical protein
MITEGDLVAVHSNYNTWNSPTRSHAQSLGQRSIDGHSQAEPHANLERLLAAQGESGGGRPGTGIPPARSPPGRSFSIFSASQRDRSPSRPSSRPRSSSMNRKSRRCMSRGDPIKRSGSRSSIPRSAHASSTTVAGVISAGEGSAFLSRAVSARSTTMPASRLGDVYSPSRSSSRSQVASPLEQGHPRAAREVQRYPALSHLVSTT